MGAGVCGEEPAEPPGAQHRSKTRGHGRKAGVFPEDSAGSCKSFSTWEPGHRPQRWAKTQNGADVKGQIPEEREGRQERPGRRRAGWMNVEVGGVPPLRSNGEQRELSS